MIDNVIGNISEAVRANSNFNEGDYMRNGLLHCINCNTPKQYHFKIDEMNIDTIVWCICVCRKREIEEEEQRYKSNAKRDRIFQMRADCIQDKKMMYWTFEHDDNQTPDIMDKATRYFTKWEKVYKENVGLLLWGNTGNGKSYFAACIANALIDKGIPALMTNFTSITNDLQGFTVTNKNEYIRNLMNHKLLIIDDLGVERSTEFAREIVYNVIDSRSKNKQPLIITTNLLLDEIKNPVDTACKRIYSRILEMCVPIKFEGADRRVEMGQRKKMTAKEIFTKLDSSEFNAEDYPY
jgi:DNA replication protein DnaC